MILCYPLSSDKHALAVVILTDIYRWGIQCVLKSTAGTIDVYRHTNSSWTAGNPKWSDAEPKTEPSWALEALQTPLGYNAPGASMPGIGQAFTMSARSQNVSLSGSEGWDYETAALNLLYAECEARRMIFETAATNASRAKPEYFYDAADREQTEYYRMTYVPLILFAAIGAILIASGICFGMIVYTWRSASGLQLRKVDVLRLVVDSVAGLRDDLSFTEISSSSNDGIDEWADGYMVKYSTEYDDEKMNRKVMLRRSAT